VNSHTERRAPCRLGRLLTASLFLLAGGCGSLIATGPAPDLYSLTPKSTFDRALPKVTWQLVIEEPLAAGGLDTTRIAVRPTPTALKYFADARWIERAPRMMQTLMVESFENTGQIVAVGRQAIGLRSDFNLKTELREFQAEYFEGTGRAPDVRVRLNVKIVRQPSQTIIASRSFERVVKATGRDVPAVVEAFDLALGRVLKELVAWCMVTTDSVAQKN
jgi:cholesterol transport system auxiliary component